MKRREEMLATVNAMKDRYLEPILGRFPRLLPTKPDSAARYALYSAVAFFGLWMLMAGVSALQLVFPTFLTQFPFMGYGRLRQAETNLLAWGVLFTGAMGAAFAIVPRLCGRPLWSERIGAQLVVLWDHVVIVATVLLMLGRTQGSVGIEWPWYVDLVVLMVMFGVLQVVMTTVMRRPEKPLNPPAKFFIAAFHVIPVTYAVGNLLSPFVFGVKQTFYVSFATSGFLLGMSLIGIGSTLFVLPRATGRPIWSERTADWTFWLTLFTLPWLGLAGRVLGPAPDWTETLGIAMAIAATVPALFAVYLAIANVRGGVGKDPAVLFMLGATLIWSLAIAQHATGILRHPSNVVGTTWWAEGVRTAFMGAFGLWLVGLTYHLIPRIRGRALHSDGLVRAHFWLGAIGVGLAWMSLSVAGLIQGYLHGASSAAGATFTTAGWRHITDAVRPMLITRMTAGGLVAAAVVLFLFNVQRTLAEGRETELEPVVVPAAEPVRSRA